VLARRAGPGRDPRRLALLICASLLVAGVVTWRFADHGWLYSAYLVLAAVAVPLAVVDLAEHRIPDRVVKPAILLLALLLGLDALAEHDAAPLARALVAAAALYIAALALTLAGPQSLGWGDTKLLAFTGLCLGPLGWNVVLGAMLIAFAAAGLGALLLRASGRLPPGRRIALAPYLLLGTLAGVVVYR
jgi:leader peptidase (prepilin peptidase) / N-methyltransferase